MHHIRCHPDLRVNVVEPLSHHMSVRDRAAQPIKKDQLLCGKGPTPLFERTRRTADVKRGEIEERVGVDDVELTIQSP